MAASVDKRHKDGRDKAEGTGQPAGSGSGSVEPRDQTDATGEQAPAGDAGWTDHVVQLPDTGESRFGNALAAPFGRYGHLTLTTVSVLVLVLLIYLAIDGLIVPR